MENSNKFPKIAYPVMKTVFCEGKPFFAHEKRAEVIMRKCNRDLWKLIGVGIVCFGLGIFLTFFLSVKFLIFIESILIIAAGTACLICK